MTMTLTAGEIKDLLEQQFPGCNGQTINRILQVSSGLHVHWSVSAAPCQKIVNVTLLTPANAGPIDRIVEHGVVQHPAKLYRVTVDNFLASGAENFSVLQQGTNQIGGPQDIDALVAYLSATYKSPKSAYDRKIPLCASLELYGCHNASSVLQAAGHLSGALEAQGLLVTRHFGNPG